MIGKPGCGEVELTKVEHGALPFAAILATVALENGIPDRAGVLVAGTPQTSAVESKHLSVYVSDETIHWSCPTPEQRVRRWEPTWLEQRAARRYCRRTCPG